MAISVDSKNTAVVGLPDDANTTTSVNEEPSAQPYKPTSYVNNFCDAVDHEVASILADYRRMDSESTGAADTAKGVFSATFGGVSASVMSMVSGTLRIVGPLVDHPIDTAKKIAKALPEGIQLMGDDAKRGVNLIREGRYAEGTFMLSKSGTDIAAVLTGAEGVVKGATTVVSKGVRLGAREIAAGAAAVREGMEGGGGALATASGVYMVADAAVAVPAATMSMPGSGFLRGPLLMSMAEDAAGGAAELGSKESPLAQADMQARFKPVLESNGRTFQKYGKVWAREASEGEVVVTRMADGSVETTNTAHAGDYVLKNPGGEEYILSGKKLQTRYSPTEGEAPSIIDGKSYSSFTPSGRAVAVQFTRELAESRGLKLNAQGEYYFTASWGETMVIKEGDMMVSALDATGKADASVYRIEAKAFKDTYASVKATSIFDAAAESFASSLHNDWRASRSLMEGAAADGLPLREPRWKAVAADDAALSKIPTQFKRVIDGKAEVDIANLDFGRLPAKYQFENAAAAEGAVRVIGESSNAEGIVGVDLEAASARVHDQWLERNGSWAPPEQNKPYSTLSEIEKEKDRVVVRAAAQAINDQMRTVGQNTSIVLH